LFIRVYHLSEKSANPYTITAFFELKRRVQTTETPAEDEETSFSRISRVSTSILTPSTQIQLKFFRPISEPQMPRSVDTWGFLFR
jgi:hypothetical protein